MKGDDILNLGKRIKNIRESKSLRQEDVFTGIVSSSHYSNIESGRYNAATDTIKLIANRLNVPENYLLSIDINCNETQDLLEEYELLVETGNIQATSTFLIQNKARLKYIPSINQEAYYQLISFLHLLNSHKYKEALDLFDKYPMNDIQVSFEEKQRRIYLYASGIYYFMIISHKNSIAFFKELLNISDDTSIYKPKVLYNIAMSLYNTYKFSEAIEYAKKSEILYLQLHEWVKVGDCYNLLVVLNRDIKNYKLAKSYLEKGFNIVKPDSFELLAKLYHNSSLISFDKGNYKEALENINRSIEIKSNNSIPGMFVSYKLKLNILLNIDDLLMLNKTLKKASKFIKTKVHEAQFLYIEAKKYYILGGMDLYESNIVKAIKILQTQKNWKELITVAEHYSSFLERNKKYKSSLEFQKICNYSMKNMYEEEISL